MRCLKVLYVEKNHFTNVVCLWHGLSIHLIVDHPITVHSRERDALASFLLQLQDTGPSTAPCTDGKF